MNLKIYFPEQRQPTCLGCLPKVRVALRFACLLASAQFFAVAVPKANAMSPGRIFPGILSFASALQLQVHPQLGFFGLGIVRSWDWSVASSVASSPNISLSKRVVLSTNASFAAVPGVKTSNGVGALGKPLVVEDSSPNGSVFRMGFAMPYR